ncbi:MAG: hypothetical protein IKZ49_00165 [Alphaproteobacteria bacterium]|nr:hypothetical protein [Alphaproteobacteria bacterium]
MLERCKYFLDKKYKKVKYCTLLRHFRAYLRMNNIDFDKVLYSLGIKKVEYTHLTKYVRKHGTDNIQEITTRTNVDLHLGALPHELLKLVKKEEVKQKTKEFFAALDEIVAKYGDNLSKREHKTYNISEIGKIFNTYCLLETYKCTDEFGIAYETWEGSFGNVYKLSFPEIGTEYALKIYKNVEKQYKHHGAFYEIPISFCANKIEPKQNNTIYIGKLHSNGYMISDWQEQQDDNFVIPSRLHPVFETSNSESDCRKCNFINGLRTDYGETYKTWYGNLSYNVRKWYRTMQVSNLAQIKYKYSKLRTNFDKDDFYSATELFFNEYVNNNRLCLNNSQREEINNLLKKKNIEIFDKYFKQTFPAICR